MFNILYSSANMRVFLGLALLLSVQVLVFADDCPTGLCPSSQTCCPGPIPGIFGCCPSPNAVCCSDGEHCCPQNTVCDLDKGTCDDKRNLLIPFAFRKNEINVNSVALKKAKKVEVVYCPGGTSYCPDGNTCCILPNGQFGCCPYPSATCCNDRIHCCPYGTHCDPTSQVCLKTGTGMPVAPKRNRSAAILLE